MLVVGLVAWTPLAVLTGQGMRRRGGRWLTTVAAGVCFATAWLAWYVVDERPYRRGRHNDTRVPL